MLDPQRSRERFPRLVLGAEMHNSSSSTPSAITAAVERISELGADTVLAPVAWSQFEPHEGLFQYGLIDHLLRQAEARGMQLVVLWFGTWKNASSSYAPAWVLRDPERFVRSAIRGVLSSSHLSPFCTATRDADAAAFAALMAHLCEIDTSRTVLAVQVENETGLLGDSRDRCDLAEAAFRAPVPAAVLSALHLPVDASPTAEDGVHEPPAPRWEDLPLSPERRDEAFMAAAFAQYVEAVAAAGLTEHDVPLFVNAWLDSDSALDGPVQVAGGKQPGDYPSGGPVTRVAPIWSALAPSIAFAAPDVYVDDSAAVFEDFRSAWRTLFIPEIRADRLGLAQMFLAVGTFDAVGVSPFGVDHLDPASASGADLRDAYQLLAAARHLLEDPREAAHGAFLLTGDRAQSSFRVGDRMMRATLLPEAAPGDPGFGIWVALDDDIYLIGRGFRLTIVSEDDGPAQLLDVEALRFDETHFEITAVLNGDETESGTALRFPHRDDLTVPGQLIPTRLHGSGIVRFKTLPA